MSFKQIVFTGLMLVIMAFAAALWFYPQLPNPMPSHWDAAGHINGYLPRTWGAFLLPLTMLVTWILFTVLPRISPKGFRLDSFLPVYGIVNLAALGTLLLMTFVVLFAARGAHVPMQRIAPLLAGILMMVIGNYLGKFRKNFFAGIRTPWTFASDEVWTRTHRLGGWFFVAGGLVIAATGLIAPSEAEPAIQIGTVILSVAIPYVGSYFIYRRVEGFDRNRQDD
jgi:uncharacterized membrane protein